MLFLTLAVTPVLFASLPRRDAGRVAARMFPAYYAASLVLPAAALAALLLGPRRGRRRRASAALLGVAVAAGSANAFVLRPSIERARALMDAPSGLDGAAAQTFARLHAASVGTVLLLMLLAAAVIAIEILSEGERPPDRPAPG
jgi:hypothetical protein